MHTVKSYIEIVNVIRDKLIVLENTKHNLSDIEKKAMFDDVRALAKKVSRGMVDLDL